MTPSEAALWEQLRAHKLGGLKFRRQHPIAGYIVDFCCTDCGLVIEVDGDVHAGRENPDEQRALALNARGYRIIRFTNQDVQTRMMSVLETILRVCEQTPPPTPPLRGEVQKRVSTVPDSAQNTAPNWQPALYDTKHAFVAKYGEALLDLLAPKPGERILDLGCGTGDLTQKIADCGATVIGLDSSLDMIAAARAKYPVIEFVPGDATSFAFDAPFDAVFSNATLHWVKPPEDAARCISRALRPGGRFVAEFGGAGNVAHISAALHDAHMTLTGAPLQHNWYFPSIGAYAPILEAHGLEVQAAWLFDRPTPLEGEDGMRNWLTMFGGPILRGAPTDVIDRVTAVAERTLRDTSYRDGQWFADYRRIRVVAIKK
jgi:very-short-patch-repair endonuclease/trans-aconitate methyltransferase